jgi:hypothetical protein
MLKRLKLACKNITKGQMKEIEAARVRKLRTEGHELPLNKEKDKRYQVSLCDS